MAGTPDVQVLGQHPDPALLASPGLASLGSFLGTEENWGVHSNTHVLSLPPQRPVQGAERACERKLERDRDREMEEEGMGACSVCRTCRTLHPGEARR